MNKILWNKILDFDLDDPPGEYGFSIRLANENFWTTNFTQTAILEYKKFMYLAAIADAMVSPSEIVDIVWHQHLIFTQSYQDFCNRIGKQVQHVPSTHNRQEFEKFQQAKERTKKLYEIHFGAWPTQIWEYQTMYESLHLEKAKLNLRTFVNYGIGVFILLIIPVYFLLKPLIVSINNPVFILSYLGINITGFLLLEFYNRISLRKILRQFDSESFCFQLQPMELIYLKTGMIGDVVNGTLHELVSAELITINNDHTLQMSGHGKTNNLEELQVMNVLNSLRNPSYGTLMHNLKLKPVFWNVANCMKAFIKYFNKSKKFASIFYLNFAVLSLIFMFGLIRLVAGIIREKPFTQILVLEIVLISIIIFYLQRLVKLFFTDIVPAQYKQNILPTKLDKENWQWSYFLQGSAVFMPAFIPLISSSGSTSTNYGSGNDSGGCGSTCGSSCGSCGSCGGCGD